MRQIVAYIHVSETGELLFHPNITSFSYIRENLKTLAEMNNSGYKLQLMYDYNHSTNPAGYNDKSYTKKLAIFEVIE